MGKFNTGTVRSATSSPVRSEAVPTARTYEGAAGHARDIKSELFLLSVANMVGQDTFYEGASERDDRFRDLVRTVAIQDPEWLVGMIGWLRSEADMRTASGVAAAEMVKARTEAGAHGWSRQAVNAALLRAEEPGEILAYWLSKYGKTVPIAFKRGLADAIVRLYTERSLLKYDNRENPLRFGDIIEIVQPRYHVPSVRGTWRDDLYRYAIERRHDRGNAIPERLRVVAEHKALLSLPVAERRAFIGREDASETFARVGLTWKSLAPWLQGPMDAKAWEAIAPSMGIFALARNLRNFDEAGVSDLVAEQVAAKISDPAIVAKSRMFPFRFWAAYKHTHSLRWAHALEKALTASLANVPSLPGRTLVLVDRSPSMFPGYHFSTPNKSDITLAEQAAVFGAAVALRAHDATLVEFGGESRPLPLSRGGSVLKLVEQFGRSDGTDIPSAVKQHYAGHDRVVVVTDEQSRPGYLPSNMAGYGGMRETAIDDLIPRHVPVYLWNFAGYKPGVMPSGSENRHTFGGLSDAAFRLVPLLEAGRSADWPWIARPVA